MPIAKKPVVHKFGIISHSQRIHLQERLLKQSYLETFGQKSVIVHKNPVEISDEFVTQYNNAKSSEDKERLDGVARKILERIKRKVGLKDGGQGSHVDLPFAWTDLCLLSQCKGQIQEDCLDVFISSLEQAPLLTHHLPALFYLAETCLYWLRTDAAKQPYLRSAEIKLLKMGELVFLKLFYHHMAGHLESYIEAKQRLFTYLNGLDDYQEIYNPYPNALFSLRYINQVGKILVNDLEVLDGTVPETSDKHDAADNSNQTEIPETTQQSTVGIETNDLTESHQQTVTEDIHISEDIVGHEPVTEDAGTKEPDSGRSSEAGVSLSRSVHDLSPTLWHALDIWRCTSHLSGGLTEALAAISVCGKSLNKENWIDGVLAIKILSEAARSDLTVLKTMMNLAQGVHHKQNKKSSMASADASSSKSLNTSSQDERIVAPLSDIQEGSETNVESPDFDSISQDSRPTNPLSGRSKPSHQELPPASSSGADQDEPSSDKSSDKIVDDSSGGQDKARSEGDKLPVDGGFLSDHMCAAAWNELNPEESPRSVATYTNAVSDSQGIHGWHWEVAVTYANLLTELIIHGSTSHVQKRALIGANSDIPLRQQYQGIPMKSCGLVDLVYFKAAKEASDLGPNDWSWRVRYAAIQGLVKICRHLAGNVVREGTRTAVWSVLSKVKTQETDSRVLEALKVGQVEVTVNGAPDARHSALHGQIAAQLAAIYLPQLPPVVPPYTPRKTTPRRPAPTHKRDSKPLRTTLRDEIHLATSLPRKIPDFKTRADFDLRRVVEDQWRKQLQQELLSSEDQCRQEIEDHHQNDITQHHDKMQRKQDKLANNKRPNKNVINSCEIESSS